MKTLTFLAGWLLVGLGFLGIFLPLLPTTPLLLLASACFMRSSPRCRQWLLENRWCGPYLRDWEERRGVRRSVKVVAVTTVLLAIGFLWLRSGPVWIPAVGSSLAAVGLFVVWRLPVISEPSAVSQLATETARTVQFDSESNAA